MISPQLLLLLLLVVVLSTTLSDAVPLMTTTSAEDNSSNPPDLADYKYPIDGPPNPTCRAFHDLCSMYCGEAEIRPACKGPIDGQYAFSCVCLEDLLDLTDYIYTKLLELEFEQEQQQQQQQQQQQPPPSPISYLQESYLHESYCSDYTIICSSLCGTESGYRATCELRPDLDKAGSSITAECTCGGSDGGSDVSSLAMELMGEEYLDEDDDYMANFYGPEEDTDNDTDANDTDANAEGYDNNFFVYQG